jgi:predicted transposase/invertase (TIGR01784 family)
MRRDTLFYRLFQQNPTLLFDLLPTPPDSPHGYTFDSIEVKETSFRIDGVLIPPDSTGLFLFSEVQMQPDPKLYERLHSEIAIYAYRHDAICRNWQAMVIYPSRSIEQSDTNVPAELFESGRILPIYLNELGDIDNLSVGLGLLVLTILEGDAAIREAQALMTRARLIEEGNAIMEMISTIIVYKFTTLSREEVNAMLGYTIDELKQTRVYQEAKAEGEQSGRREEAISLILRQISHRFGNLPSSLMTSIEQLPLAQLETLSLAWLEFKSVKDLEHWLENC